MFNICMPLIRTCNAREEAEVVQPLFQKDLMLGDRDELASLITKVEKIASLHIEWVRTIKKFFFFFM